MKENNKSKIILGVILVVLVLVGGGLFLYFDSDGYKYSKANRLLEEGNTDEALLIFDEIQDYEDAAQIAIDTRYNIALTYYSDNDYLMAIETFSLLGDYKNSLYFLDLCNYNHAHQLFLEKNYDEADIYFSKMSEDAETGYPHFRELEEAKKYILNQGLRAEEEIILYIGDLEVTRLDEDLRKGFIYFAQTDAGYTEWIKPEKMLVINPVVYPGVKIVAYHRQNRTQELTQKETELYQKALQLVKQAQEESSTPYEVELWINNWLCENSSLADEYTYDNEDDLANEHTAYGPILYGQSDSMGFSDAFYLLASLCDFNVRIQFGTDSSKEYTNVWNAIELDGQWHYVDVDWNNYDKDTRFEPSYAHFNFVDTTSNNHISYDYARICETPDEINLEFDYYHINNCSFDTLSEAAKYAINQKLSYGKKTVLLKVNQPDLDNQDMIDALDARLSDYGYNLTVQATPRKEDTCYIIYWTSLYK